jgi:hypothetical protein
MSRVKAMRASMKVMLSDELGSRTPARRGDAAKISHISQFGRPRID